jgi:hypothetical protein
MDSGNLIWLSSATTPERPQQAEEEPGTHDVADMDAGSLVRVAHGERLQLESANQRSLAHTRASRLASFLLGDDVSGRPATALAA